MRATGAAPSAAIFDLRQARLAHMVQLGETLHSWAEEIATMWRFTRNDSITEGFHTKREVWYAREIRTSDLLLRRQCGHA